MDQQYLLARPLYGYPDLAGHGCVFAWKLHNPRPEFAGNKPGGVFLASVRPSHPPWQSAPQGGKVSVRISHESHAMNARSRHVSELLARYCSGLQQAIMWQTIQVSRE